MTSTLPEQSRLVIAEDDPLIRRSLVSAARERGFLVAGEAATGPDAVTQVICLRPDAVLMDVEMPGFDGLEAARRIQKLQPTPIVVVTAHDSSDLLQSIAGSGAGAYLLKPVNPADLACAIAIARARHADLLRLGELIKQKECLVREVYHRVAGQLSIAATLIHLQALRAPGTATREALFACENRIRAMGRIHAALQGAQNQADIPLAPYLSGIARELVEGLRPDLDYQEHLPDQVVTVTSSIAVACGLLAHELVMNCLKHAFGPTQYGTIRLALTIPGPGRLRLTVADTGCGLPARDTSGSQPGLGLMIADSLAKDLKSTLGADTGPEGTTFSIEFNHTATETPP